MVPGVERLGPNIDFLTFGDLEVLTEREILLDLPRAEHPVVGIVAKLIIGRIFERLTVTDTADEPLRAIVLGTGVWIARTLDRTPVRTGSGRKAPPGNVPMLGVNGPQL